MDRNKHIESSEIKAALYTFLSSLSLGAPDNNIHTALKERRFSSLVETMYNDLSDEVIEGMKELESMASTMKDSELERLSIDYTRLFRGVKKGYSPPPPYESVYKEGFVMGRSANEVKNEYNSLGISLAKDLKGEPPDHIAFELEFMSILCLKESEALGEQDEDFVKEFRKKQKDFLEKHLVQWFPDFHKKLMEDSSSSFYTTLTTIIRDFIQHHSRILDEEP